MIRLGLVFYLVFLMLTAPTSFLSQALRHASRGHAVLSETDGTVWSGSGVLTLLSQGTSGASLRGQWRIRPLAFLFGRAGLDVVASGPGSSIAGGVEVGRHALVLTRFVATLPAAWLSLLNVPLPTGVPDGQIRLETKKLALNSRRILGDASFTWQNAATANAGRLGSYRATVSGQGEQGKVNLETMGDGALVVSGNGWWEPKTGVAKLEGHLSATGGAPALQQLLEFVGPEQAGRRAFALTGTFRLPL